MAWKRFMPSTDDLSTPARNDVLTLPTESWHLAVRPFSLDDVVNEDDDGYQITILDIIADRMTLQPDDEAEQELMAEHVRQALAELPPRERRVLEAYYGEDRAYVDIGHEIGLSRTRVGQLRYRGLKNMRRILQQRFGITKAEVSS